MPAGLVTFALRRLFVATALVLLVSTSAVVLVRFAPGDATTALSLSRADAATIAATRARLGLDRPLSEQLWMWACRLARLDLGESSTFGRPVRDLVGERALNTARLATAALALAMAIGLPLGVLSGANPDGAVARGVSIVSVAMVSCPPLVGALVLMALAIHTGWLSIRPGALLLPALALALPLAAMFERVQSQATTDVLGTPGLTAAAARGIPRWRLLWVHAGRQSLRPVLGVFGVMFGSLFSGSLAVEWVTSWPGLGRLMYDAIVGRDTYLVAGCALLGAILIAIGNFAADLLLGAADPRVVRS